MNAGTQGRNCPELAGVLHYTRICPRRSWQEIELVRNSCAHDVCVTKKAQKWRVIVGLVGELVCESLNLFAKVCEIPAVSQRGP